MHAVRCPRQPSNTLAEQLRCFDRHLEKGWIMAWQFPMYRLDLSMIDVDVETLREQQRNWTPEDW